MIKKILATVCLLGLLPFATPAVAEAVQTPFEAVQESTDLLIAKLKELQPIYASDPDRFFDEVEATLDPYIDFEEFSKRVMAKHFRRATDAQKLEFRSKFRESLIKTYGSALVEFDNQKVVVLEPTAAQQRPGEAAIDLEVHGSGGKVYPVRYQLRLEGDRWLLYNVQVNKSINIGLQFRSQFQAAIQKHRGDIGQVIADWSSSVDA